MYPSQGLDENLSSQTLLLNEFTNCFRYLSLS